jgi:large subunit ribosomal protein L25
MKQHTLNVEPRTTTGKGESRAVRRDGFIPAVIYGGGQPNAHVVVAEKEIRTALRAGAAKGIVTLNAPEGAGLAIIKATQYDALGDHLEHVDFYRVTMDRPVHLPIPLVTRGRAPGEQLGGIVEHLVREVTISCLPTDIPDGIVVDIGELGVGQGIHLGAIPPPPGVSYLDPPETAVVVCKASRMAKAATEAEEAAEKAAAEAAAVGEPAEGEETPPAAPGKATPAPAKGSAPKKEK